MMSCDQVRSHLLEHLYDLLEEDCVRALDDHLRSCGNCQAELGHAREQMALIATAAKEEFPKVHFVPPTDETSKVFKTSGASIASRRWGIRWSAAAAILLAVVGVAALAGIYWRHESQVAQAENTLRQTKDELATADTKRLRILDEAQAVKTVFRLQLDEADKGVLLARNDLTRLGQDFQQKIQQARSDANAKQMDLTITGPRALEPGAPNQFHIHTQSFRLQPIPARITVVVRDQDKLELFKKENLASRGDLLVNLPQGLPVEPKATLMLEVEARSENPQVVLTEELPLTEPLYVTHLTTDKSIYRPGETVGFRSLSLERYSLRPPTDDLELSYKITKPTSEVTTILKCLAAARNAARDQRDLLGPDQKPIRGIGGGKFKIDMQAPPGQYTLTVTESQQRFPPQEIKFQVVRSDKPGPSPEFLAADKKLNVEFYPESGELIAGMPNRVYFQVIAEQNKPSEFKGRILDESGKSAASLETFREPSHPEVSQGRGVFTFTPQAGKEYQLKIDEPARIEGKFTLPSVKRDGVVLSIPSAVVKDNEPIKAVIRNVGADRALLVGVYCRGRVMSQQSVGMKNGEVKEVKLGPDSGVGGVYRVTVFERAPDQTRGERLEPRAERLIYRSPAGRLRLKLQPDKPSHIPGERAHIRIAATNVSNRPQPTIAAATVVDQSALNSKAKTPVGMPAYFLLADELQRPEELRNADFLLSGDPRAAKALDLLLGTQGWRRFAEQDSNKFLKEHKHEARRLLALEGQWPPRTVNHGQEAVQKVVKEFHKQYAALERRLMQAEETQVAAQNGDAHETKIARLRERGQQAEDERLAAIVHVKESQESLTIAADKFQRYREFLGGILLSVMLIVFLVVAAANLALAVRWRSQRRAIPYLACAACSLLLVTLVLTQKANLLHDITIGSGTEIAGLGNFPNDDWIAEIRLDEKVVKPGPARNELANNPGQPPFIGRVQPGGSPLLENKDNKPPADKPKQVAPPDHNNLLPRLPVPPRSAPPFVAREYVHLRTSSDGKDRQDKSSTLFWNPVLVLPDGSAEIAFDLSDAVTTYQVIVTAHTLDGRLAEEVINIPVKKPDGH